ncbi:MAG: chorismate-binding protein [Flavobacteriaceae bacterium]
MSSESFFASLQEHYNKNLPFVAYSKPKSFQIRALLQKDQTLHKIEDYSESGFVFSPFDIRKDSLLIPLSMCKTLMTEDDVHIDDFEMLNNISVGNKEEHINLVNKGIKAIEHSGLSKVVLSRMVESNKIKADPFLIFKRLLHTYNSAFVYCWYHPRVGLWLGATPETLLEVEGNNFSTMALAGTQAYEGVMDVRWKEKEQNEQQIVVDYITSNIKSFTISLEVSEPETIRAGNILHLKSDIKGRLSEHENGLQKLIYALHPTPAVCGFPKIDAMQFILDNENYNREFYSGFLGELNKEVKVQTRTGKLNIENRAFTYNKRASHLFVNLRCMQIKDNVVKIYVGGGITNASIPEKEWEETIAKMHTIKSVLS